MLINVSHAANSGKSARLRSRFFLGECGVVFTGWGSITSMIARGGIARQSAVAPGLAVLVRPQAAPGESDHLSGRDAMLLCDLLNGSIACEICFDNCFAFPIIFFRARA